MYLEVIMLVVTHITNVSQYPHNSVNIITVGLDTNSEGLSDNRFKRISHTQNWTDITSTKLQLTTTIFV